MSGFLDLMLPAFAACIVLVGIHGYLGLHIIARGVIFVDLSLAQMAALGATTAFLFNVSPDSSTGFWVSLLFTTIGAAIFSLTRTETFRVPQEAIIGIVFVVASAAAILVADKAPRGAEHIKEMLSGSILWVSWPTVGKIAGLYAVIGVLQYVWRRRFLTISFEPERADAEGWNIKAWDFLFYTLFGLVVTSSVAIAGVLMVFTFLVVPAVIAFFFTRRQGWMAIISWSTGAVASAAGLTVSYFEDLPTGPAIVCTFAVVLIGAAALRKWMSVQEARRAPFVAAR